MDGGSELSDAEMRLVTVNGQTIMLEGEFENISMTNEFLNEILMGNNSKIDIGDGCNIQVDENSCINCEKETCEESPKFEISIQGDNDELEMVQIGMEEAKALGLYFYECKNDEEINTWSNTLKEEQEEEDLNLEEGKVSDSLESEICKVKLHSVPVANVGYVEKEQGSLLLVNEVDKCDEDTSVSHPENISLEATSKVEKHNRQVQDENIDGLPAIGHLEGFQIPTTEDGLLLPTTVNAKMVDGSHQTITLVPQVVNGSVTYTVHFSHLPKEVIEKNLNNTFNDVGEVEKICNSENSVNKEINSEINSVEDILSSVQLIKMNNQRKHQTVKKIVQNQGQKLNNGQTVTGHFANSTTNGSIMKLNDTNQESVPCSEVPVNYLNQNQLPIDAKIDNLISENENVISRCKKVKYGKKMKANDVQSVLTNDMKVTKSSATKAKKVKFKSKGIKLLNEELEKKKLKLSLLKPSNEHKLDSGTKRGQDNPKIVNPSLMPHMNLNGRLEYPNLKAIDETASSFTYIKVKNPQVTKQPYFNVLPYPKDKTIPVQKQILPLNCDLQQAKNLISLQKFLETQKLQLKIQPIVPNGNKIVNIRPKPTIKSESKALNAAASPKQGVNNLVDKHLIGDVVRDCSAVGSINCSVVTCETQEDEPVKKLYQENIKSHSSLLNDQKMNNLKFLKPESASCDAEEVKEENKECTNKFNEIFIKNNPEYFSQKSKDKKSEEHPLGSTENPIQLVQTGHTFHSRQPLSEAQLRQIASILQKQKFDSPNLKKNSIFDPKTNTRIVYRVVYPEDVELKDADRSSVDNISKRKRGRHKAKPVVGEDETQKKPSLFPRGPGRPKKSALSAFEEDLLDDEIEETPPKKKIPRTRSGRLSRPPRYMVKDYKRLHNSDVSEKTSDSNFESDDIYPAYESSKEIPLERTDNIENIALDTNLLPGLRPPPRTKRNFKPEYRCPTCQKIYLGHTRMMWHLNKFPDHCNVEKYEENYFRKRTETKVRRAARRLNMYDVTNKVKQALNSMSKDELTSFCGPLLADTLTTWDFLLLRVNLLKNSRKDEVDALIQELVLLLEKLTKMAEDIFLPVFSKETEKDEDCIEIDRMEVAIALGLPVGFYKINNENLNLLRIPLMKSQGAKELKVKDAGTKVTDRGGLFADGGKDGGKMFGDKGIGSNLVDPWKNGKTKKKMVENSFWLENKEDGEDGEWRPSNTSLKTLSTKFEPNLSTKLLESSNDSLDDGKYEEPVHLMDLDSNSKDVDQSNSSENLDENLVKEQGKMSEMPRGGEPEEKSSLWSENSTDKVPDELWNENSVREKWDAGSDMVEPKSSTELWTNENSEMAAAVEKPASHLWTENSNITGTEKVDDTNSEFLDSFLSVPNSNGFLSNETGGFLAQNIGLINGKDSELKSEEDGQESKEKNKWRTSEDDGSTYMRVWDAEKNPTWPKEDAHILTGSGIQDRMPGIRTGARLTSTPETNGSIPFSISHRRNSISDFSNINLESANLDMVLPSAKTLIKDCLKTDEGKFEMKEESYLERPDNFKVKTWGGDSAKSDFSPGNVNSEDLMKMALESLTSQHDVINVQATTFDSAMGILHQNQEPGNLNLFAASEADGLDFNLPLPDHLLRTNFAPAENFPSGCEQHTGTADTPSGFLSTTSNIFGTTCTLSNSIKFDQFEASYPDKKSKSLDDVMEFFDAKSSFNGFEGAGSHASSMNGFTFASHPGDGDGDGFQVDESTATLRTPAADARRTKKKKPRPKKPVQKRLQKPRKKTKVVDKKAVDYPKSTNTIESIINEALFDGCPPPSKPLQMQDSSPSGGTGVSALPSATDNYALPIISGSLDEVENLDFLSQD